MTEENDNQIQLRSAAGIGRQSDLARRGMNAAKSVSPSTIPTDYKYEFLLRWGTKGSGDGQFGGDHSAIAVASDVSVYFADYGNNRIQKFTVGP